MFHWKIRKFYVKIQIWNFSRNIGKCGQSSPAAEPSELELREDDRCPPTPSHRLQWPLLCYPSSSPAPWVFNLHFFFCIFFSGPHSQHMDVLRRGVEGSNQSCSCHSSRQCWILNPLSEARDRTHILMDTSGVCNWLNHNRNASTCTLNEKTD